MNYPGCSAPGHDRKVKRSYLSKLDSISQASCDTGSPAFEWNTKKRVLFVPSTPKNSTVRGIPSTLSYKFYFSTTAMFKNSFSAGEISHLNILFKKKTSPVSWISVPSGVLSAHWPESQFRFDVMWIKLNAWVVPSSLIPTPLLQWNFLGWRLWADLLEDKVKVSPFHRLILLSQTQSLMQTKPRTNW